MIDQSDGEVIRLLQGMVNELRKLNRKIDSQAQLLDKQTVLLRKAGVSLEEIKKSNDVLRRQASNAVLREVKDFSRTNQYSFEETLVRLADEELSFARFGDGEFRLMTHLEYNLGFQPNSNELMSALENVLVDPLQQSDKLLIGFPFVFRNLFGSAIWSDVWEEVSPLFDRTRMYGNSHVTRPVFFKFMGDRGVDLWRRVWAAKEVRVITGEGSRFVAIPQLFDSAKSISFHYTKPTNAFGDLDSLISEIISSKDYELNLIALGPSGTILASRLANQGIRAIDVGHLNGSFENIHGGAPKPEHTPPVRS